MGGAVSRSESGPGDGGRASGAREFERSFGVAPRWWARAPGRVNLIGEHTDYNQGLVLPCAIDRDTVAWAAPRADGRVRVRAHDLDADASFDPHAPTRRGDWLDFVQGVCAALTERGLVPPAVDLWIASRVPPESGLSSSAALGVAVAAVLARAGGLDLDARACAEVAHHAESRFVGVGCGILDHFASALGRPDSALRIDCRDRSVREVPLPHGRVSLLVSHSGVTRALARGCYRERVTECESALQALERAGVAPAGAASLRAVQEVPIEQIEAALESRLARRVRHVVSENRRVDAFATALAQADLVTAGAILEAGQRSLRDDYEVSIPELDALCDAARGVDGVYGSRLTGAGFGGCTLHLVEREAAEGAAMAIAERAEPRLGQRPPVLTVRPSAGVESGEAS